MFVNNVRRVGPNDSRDTFDMSAETEKILGFRVSQRTLDALGREKTLERKSFWSGYFCDSLRAFYEAMDASEKEEFRAFQLIECALEDRTITSRQSLVMLRVARRDYDTAKEFIESRRDDLLGRFRPWRK